MWGDGNDVRRAGREVRRLADDVRAQAHSLSHCGWVQWDSPAADLYRTVLGDQVRAALTCAADLERAGGLLATHARSVDAHLATLHALGLGGDAA